MKLHKMFLCIGVILLPFALYSEEISKQEQKIEPAQFVILICSWNNEMYAEENLRSACFQKSSLPYQVIYVNDCSTDRTGEIVENFVRENNLQSMVTIVHNKENVGPLLNYYNAIHSLIPDGKVVVNLDGDDMLINNEVLLFLEKVYEDKDVWITYGNCLEYPAMKPCEGLKQVPENVINEKLFRKVSMPGHHLRTFKSELFKKIRKESLMRDGSFFRTGGDHAMLYPMMEMSTPYKPGMPNHSRFIKEILYYWRTDTPFNDHRIRAASQSDNCKFIASLPPYESLESLS
jgi:glycosyltransferase involved in cell wall biosynthesis